MIRSRHRLPHALYAASWALCAGLMCMTAQASAAAPRPALPATKASDTSPVPLNLADERSYLLPGALHARDGLVELRTRFGQGNVTVAELDGAEGETTRGIAMVRVSGASSRWHLDNGIRPGLTLARLAAMNGKPVTFNGLDWDYGGTVTDWHGGTLAPAKDASVFMSVGLTHAEDASGYPLGEGDYRSDDRRYPKQGTVLFVGQLSLSFPAP